MQPDRFGSQASVTRAGSAVTYDAGLKAHMQRVYNRMTLGVLITALTSYVIYASGLVGFFMGGPQAYIVMLAPLAIIWFGFRPQTMSSSKLQMAFIALSVVYGISFSTIFAVFTKTDISQAFFMATALFAGLSVFGYVTKKNLDGLGTFAIMGVWGVLILSLGTMVAGMFGVEVTKMNLLISALSLLAFSGLTAYETQQTKEMYHASYGDEANSRMAWAAALNLYISFIVMFQSILNLTSNRQ